MSNTDYSRSKKINEMLYAYDIEYFIGEAVYLVTDPEQLERIVTGIIFRPSGLLYSLSYCGNESWHYPCEISMTKNIIKLTS